MSELKLSAWTLLWKKTLIISSQKPKLTTNSDIVNINDGSPELINIKMRKMQIEAKIYNGQHNPSLPSSTFLSCASRSICWGWLGSASTASTDKL